MNIKVIGCSTSWTDRPTSSYCINDNILIDCGEGTLKFYKYANVEFQNIKHIFITHLHGDHTTCITSYLCQHIFYNDESTRKTLTIYGPQGIRQHIYTIFNSLSLNYENDIVIEDYVNIVELSDLSTTLEVENLKISLTKLQHGKILDIAYIFDDGKSKVGFSGDCTYDENLEGFVKNTNYCFLECCAETTTVSHLGLDKYLYLTEKYPSVKFLAVHCIDRIYNNDKLGIDFAIHGKEYNF